MYDISMNEFCKGNYINKLDKDFRDLVDTHGSAREFFSKIQKDYPYVDKARVNIMVWMLSKPGVLPEGDATAYEFLHRCLTLSKAHLNKMLPEKFLEYFAFCLAMDGLSHGHAREELLPGIRVAACRECHTKKPNDYASLLLAIFSEKPEDKIKAAFKHARKIAKKHNESVKFYKRLAEYLDNVDNPFIEQIKIK